MTQSLKIDRDKTAVVIMDFQQRIIANNASEPENVVKQASAVLGLLGSRSERRRHAEDAHHRARPAERGQRQER